MTAQEQLTLERAFGRLEEKVDNLGNKIDDHIEVHKQQADREEVTHGQRFKAWWALAAAVAGSLPYVSWQIVSHAVLHWS